MKNDFPVDNFFVFEIGQIVRLRRRSAVAQVLCKWFFSIFFVITPVIMAAIFLFLNPLASIPMVAIAVFGNKGVKKLAVGVRYGNSKSILLASSLFLFFVLFFFWGMMLIPEGKAELEQNPWLLLGGLLFYGSPIYFVWRTRLSDSDKTAIQNSLGKVGISNFEILGKSQTNPKIAKSGSGKNPLRARMLYFGALLLVGLLLLLLIASLLFKFMGQNISLFVVIAGSLLLGKIAQTYRKSQQNAAVDANEVLKNEQAPVLYLRSFGDDAQVKISTRYADKRSWMESATRQIAFDESIVNQLWQIGPVVSVGKPGEPLPPLGALRMYLADDRWQSRVEELMHASALIVLLIGSTEGLRWEMDRLVLLGVLDKTIFIMPPTKPDDNARRWQLTNRFFNEKCNFQIPNQAQQADTLAFCTPLAQANFFVKSQKNEERDYEVGIEICAGFLKAARAVR